jgi:hypothetical protein
MNDEPPDIRLNKSDRTAARTDSKGMIMALNDRYSCVGIVRAISGPPGVGKLEGGG